MTNKPARTVSGVAATAAVVAGLVLKLVEKGILTSEEARQIYGVASDTDIAPKVTAYGSDVEAEITAVVASMTDALGRRARGVEEEAPQGPVPRPGRPDG